MYGLINCKKFLSSPSTRLKLQLSRYSKQGFDWKLFKTWLEILTVLPEDQRRGLFSAYIDEISENPQKLIAFNLDGILEIFLSLDNEKQNIISESVKKIINSFEEERKRKLLLIIPDNAQKHLKF